MNDEEWLNHTNVIVPSSTANLETLLKWTTLMCFCVNVTWNMFRYIFTFVTDVIITNSKNKNYA